MVQFPCSLLPCYVHVIIVIVIVIVIVVVIVIVISKLISDMFPDDMFQLFFQFAVILGFLFLVELGGSITGYVFRHKVSLYV